ncbi:MAG TPA: hypothetical protein VEI98_15635 [Xanthobacteraceae bacterium]|nr:hypothetical protein [Xanthobacteraceae bacterium]
MKDEPEGRIDLLRTRKEVAARLKVSMRTLARLEAAGKLPARIQVSDRIGLYRDSAIERFLAEREGAGA